jgi:hypothetical protein
LKKEHPIRLKQRRTARKKNNLRGEKRKKVDYLKLVSSQKVKRGKGTWTQYFQGRIFRRK